MQFNNLRQVALGAFNSVLTDILSFLPNLLGALAIFWLGSIIARWLGRLAQKFFVKLNLRKLFKVDFKKFLQEAGINLSLEELLAGFIRWTLVFVAFMTAVNVLGLTSVSRVLEGILSYLPKVVSTVLILAVGTLAAGFVKNLVAAGLSQLGKETAEISGKITYYLLILFIVLAAVNELGIAQSLTNIIFSGMIAALSLGFGLALGLGAKDLVGQILKEWYKNLKEK